MSRCSSRFSFWFWTRMWSFIWWIFCVLFWYVLLVSMHSTLFNEYYPKGTDITFRIYGLISLLLMAIFIYTYRRYQKQQHPHLTMHSQTTSVFVDDLHQFIGNSPLLAPHGAPTNLKWQSKFSTNLTAGIKPDRPYSSSIISTTSVIKFRPYRILILFSIIVV